MNTTDPTVANQTGDGDGDGGDPYHYSHAKFIAIICMLSVFFVVGTIGNALAFIIYYRKREKGTSTIFIISLTVTDFFTCLIAVPYSIAHEVLEYKYSFDIFCRVYIFILTFNIPLSSLILVAIGFDRYFCICHPFLHAITVPRAKKLIFILTFVSVMLGVVPFLGHSIYIVDVQLENLTVPVEAVTASSSVFQEQATSDLAASASSSFASLLSPASVTAASALAGDSFSSGTAYPPDSEGSTPRMFTDGLYLHPDSDVLDEMKHGGGVVSYNPSSLPMDQNTPASFDDDTDTDTDNDNAEGALNYNIVQVNKTIIVYYGYCILSSVSIGENVIQVYQKAYASLFLVEFVVIAILYALIYRSIHLRRAWKAKRKQKSSYSAPTVADEEETQLTNITRNNTEVSVVKKNPSRISAAMRDRTLYANVRTAAMLFVVTVVFVVSFLPSWLIGLNAINFNLVVFYLFYFNNVANPIIYAFMNRTFRDELVLLIKNCICRR